MGHKVAKVLTFGVTPTHARFWLSFDGMRMLEPTLTWDRAQVNYDSVCNGILSYADWFPRRNWERWCLRHAARMPGDRINPKSRPLDVPRNDVCITNRFRGPLQPANVMSFSEALDMWFIHMAFLLSQSNFSDSKEQ